MSRQKVQDLFDSGNITFDQYTTVMNALAQFEKQNADLAMWKSKKEKSKALQEKYKAKKAKSYW
jgi:hypothetical protein